MAMIPEICSTVINFDAVKEGKGMQITILDDSTIKNAKDLFLKELHYTYNAFNMVCDEKLLNDRYCDIICTMIYDSMDYIRDKANTIQNICNGIYGIINAIDIFCDSVHIDTIFYGCDILEDLLDDLYAISHLFGLHYKWYVYD